jgi:hypothetical protein
VVLIDLGHRETKELVREVRRREREREIFQCREEEERGRVLTGIIAGDDRVLQDPKLRARSLVARRSGKEG